MRATAVSRLIRRTALVMAAGAVVLFLSALPLRAQIDPGAVLGTGTDASGAEIRGATVTLTNEGTNAALSTTTGSDGVYKFTPVKIGSYTVSANYQGFTTTTEHHVVVNVGADGGVHLPLKPGAVTETVEVAGTLPVLATQNASVGQVVDSRAVNDLPLNGRNFTFLAQLAAGVNTTP